VHGRRFPLEIPRRIFLVRIVLVGTPFPQVRAPLFFFSFTYTHIHLRFSFIRPQSFSFFFFSFLFIFFSFFSLFSFFFFFFFLPWLSNHAEFCDISCAIKARPKEMKGPRAEKKEKGRVPGTRNSLGVRKSYVCSFARMHLVHWCAPLVSTTPPPHSLTHSSSPPHWLCVCMCTRCGRSR
jgi:hypothetical protein